jgi:1-acyl-sn-glycerol-3-phosphate acyltransferase
MRRRTALDRLAGVATGESIPWVERLLGGARKSKDHFALKLLGPDFEERLSLLRSRYGDPGRGPFGFDPDAARYAVTVCAIFHRLYFRTEVHGIEHVPEGQVLLVANHSGQLPIDAAIIGTALFLDATPPRVTRAMVEKWTRTLPFVSTFYRRVGQVVGVPDNCRRLLEMGESILVFPEGARGIAKPFSRRYQLEQFGLGFMRLALRTGAPIVPVAVIGAEEQYLSLGNLPWAARVLGMPVFPLIPQLLIPGGQLPLPTKYRIYFGQPMRFSGDAEQDDEQIEQQVWVVRQTIEGMLSRGLGERRGVFL